VSDTTPIYYTKAGCSSDMSIHEDNITPQLYDYITYLTTVHTQLNNVSCVTTVHFSQKQAYIAAKLLLSRKSA
jgi:hypothetical protein